jgi:hypothetical protein
MRALALTYEKTQDFMSELVYWQGASDAEAHGASLEQMWPYMRRAMNAMPK